MDAEDKKEELLEWLSKLEEPSVLYQIAKIKEESESETAFDLEKEWENGLTVEEAKAESKRRIREWWGK
ncbi:hypothetical protein ACI6PS_14545 [Flavobacterium sp. PLA-1-15]|uniref:hypothetical protein n=1 Tax=Flavobacterium sp. PLA-1-15 TaxID=3380533 RepID=UPI003B7C7632